MERDVLCKSIEFIPKMKLKKWYKKIILVSFILALIIIPFDLNHQKQLQMVNQAYSHMNQGEYDEALEKFSAYYEGHSEIYWILQSFIYGGDSQYSKQSIEKEIRLCSEKRVGIRRKR